MSGANSGIDALIITLIGAPIVAIAGAVYGSTTAVSEEKAYEIGVKVSDSFSEQLFAQEANQLAALLSGNEGRTVRIVPIDDFPFSTVSTLEDRQRLALHGNEDVLRINLNRWRLNGQGGDDPRLRLEMDADVSILGLASGDTVYSLDWKYRSGWKRWSQWTASDGSELRKAFKRAADDLLERVGDEAFLAYNLTPVRIMRHPMGAFQVCGLRPESSLVTALSGNPHVEVKESRPTLRWETFPRPEDMAADAPLSKAQISNITYDVRIWTYLSGGEVEDVKYVVGLRQPEYRIEEPLASGTLYGWSARARFLSDGRMHATDWLQLQALIPEILLLTSAQGSCPYLTDARRNPQRVFGIIPSSQ